MVIGFYKKCKNQGVLVRWVVPLMRRAIMRHYEKVFHERSLGKNLETPAVVLRIKIDTHGVLK